MIEIANAIDPSGQIRLEASYDELNLYVTVGYEGALLEFPTELAAGEDEFGEGASQFRFAGFIVRKLADSLTQTSHDKGHRLVLRFEH